MTATPTKIKRTGNWGARVNGTAKIGDTVTITTRAGKTWDARVTDVVWAGQGVTVCETASLDRPRPNSPRGVAYIPASGGGDYGSSYCGYPCVVTGRRCTASDPCHDCI